MLHTLLLLLLMLGCLGSPETPSENFLIVNATSSLSSNFSLPPPDTPDNITDSLPPVNNSTCPEGYLWEDGLCINQSSLNHTLPENTSSSSSSNTSNDLSNTSPDYSFNDSSSNTSEENTSSQPSINISEHWDDLIKEVPDALRPAAEEFVGDKEDFQQLIQDIYPHTNFTLSPDDIIIKELFTSDLKPDIVVDTGRFITDAVLWVRGISYFDYSEPDHRISKLRGTPGNLTVYFKSSAAMYAYTVLFPLTLYLDQDNDGRWDIKYITTYDNDTNSFYYYIKKRNDPYMVARPLAYNTDEKSITFELKEITSPRVFFWLGENITGLRYPHRNDLVMFTQKGRIQKNAVPYYIITLKNLTVKNDGDRFQEGEVFLTTMALHSLPLEQLNIPEAKRLLQYKQQGTVGDNEIPYWFAYWLFKDYDGSSPYLTFAKSSFPMVRWVEMNDNDHILTEFREAFPVLSTTSYWLNNTTIVFIGTYVGDYDDWPSSIVDKTSWLLAKLIESAATGGTAGQLLTRLTELMFYGATSQSMSFHSILENTFRTIFSYFGAPDYLGSPSISRHSPLPPGNYTVQDGDVILTYEVHQINVPTIPLHLQAKIDKIKIRDRSDGLRGEYYFYARVCTDLGPHGLTGGISLSWPAGKTGNCTPERYSHGKKKVWDGDKVAKNVVLAQGTLRARPFLYIELQGWDEDKENWGDDDDPMGLWVYFLPLDEKIFRWDVDSNLPRFFTQDSKRASKTTIYYTISISG